MFKPFQTHLETQLAEIKGAGTYKRERVISTPQGTMVRVADGQPVLNLCANNYLGLAQHPAVLAAAEDAIKKWGYGLASVRFICGTQGVHKQLEAATQELQATLQRTPTEAESRSRAGSGYRSLAQNDGGPVHGRVDLGLPPHPRSR